MKRDSVTISKAILMTISIVVLLILTTFIKNALVYTFNLDDCINLFLSIILYSISYILLFIIYNKYLLCIILFNIIKYFLIIYNL